MIFYLTESATTAIIDSRQLDPCMFADDAVEAVVQNNPTPLAVHRQTYWDIGGHDESYSGWGEEDAEFLERLRTRSISEAGWAPLVHLWHLPAPQKASGTSNRELHEAIMSQPPLERIEHLRSADLGGLRPCVTCELCHDCS
jgi:hypothetical protein